MNITIENSYCILDGSVLNSEIWNGLCHILTYTNKSIQYQLVQQKKRLRYLDNSGRESSGLGALVDDLESKVRVCLIDSSGVFPTGLLSMVESYMESKGIPVELDDRRVRPDKYISLNDVREQFPHRHYQETALGVCVERGRASIEAVTAAGKTLIITSLIKELGVKTLVVVPSINLLDQTSGAISQRFGSKYVGVVGGGRRVATNMAKDIVVATPQTLAKLDPKLFEGFDCVILDESHRSAAETYQHLNNNCFKSIYHRYFFSGTMFRNDGADLALLGITSTINFFYTAKEAIEDGFISTPIFYIYRNSLSRTFVKPSPRYYARTYAKYIVENEGRNALIVHEANRLAEAGKHVIIITNQIKHADILSDMMRDAPVIHGKTKNNEQILADFNDRKIPILIGTEVIGEGVDTVGADAIIMAAGGKAKSIIMQRIGRVLRLREGKDCAIVVDFEDKNVATFAAHASTRLGIYESEYDTQINFMDI